MKKITLEMPVVTKCGATQCAYNVGQNCHAKAITVGDEQGHRCDTFFKGQVHTQAVGRTSGVGACKVTGCAYNQDMNCSMDGIQMGLVGGEVSCVTYSARSSAVGA
jgi:hypothetical protein